MLFAYMVIDTYNTSFEYRPKSFNCIGINSSINIFTFTMVYTIMIKHLIYCIIS